MDKESNVIGERIKALRKKNRLTQKELADSACLDQAFISKIENGESRVSLSTIKSIANALNTTTAYLLGDIDWPHRPNAFEGGDDILPGQITPERKLQREALIRRIMDPNKPKPWLPTDDFDSNPADSVTPVLEKTIKLPVLSQEQTACCGSGMMALDITSWEGETAIVPLSDIGAEYDDLRPPFVICTDGDSMTEWSIPNGSRVVINPAEEVRSMDIALVNYMGKLALKKVRFNRDKSIDLLSSDGNIMHIEPEDAVPEVFNVVGKAMSLTSRIRHGI